MKFMLVSLNQAWENIEANKKSIINILQKISNDKIDWMIFPEMTLTGFSMNVEKVADKNNENLNWFKNLAKNFKINIIYGSSVLEGKYYRNKAYSISKDGNLLCEYSKIHLFSITEEDKYYKAGNNIAYFNYNGINIGLTICYDLRFPEVYQYLSKFCYIIVNIANWPDIRKNHWLTLLKARAIENQVYIIGVNRTGFDGNNIKYSKSSCIFSPDGSLIESIYKHREFDIYELNTNLVKEVRKNFPVKNDRREKLYVKWYKNFGK